MSRQILLALPVIAGLAGSSLAQSTTVVDVLIPQVDQQTILASVVSVGPDATAYSLACPPDTDATDCGIGGGFFVTAGPTTAGWHITIEDSFTADVNCVITSSVADCTDQHNGESGQPTSTTISDYTDWIVPITVTAGLELLTGGGSGTATGTAPTTKLTGTHSPTTTEAGAAGSTSKSTAGVPRVTQHAVLAGVAAIVGGVAMI